METMCPEPQPGDMDPSHPDYNTEEIIETLEHLIQDGRGGRDEAGKIITVFQKIRSNQHVQIPAGLHCEILIATLGWKRCWSAAIKDNDAALKDLCHVSCYFHLFFQSFS